MIANDTARYFAVNRNWSDASTFISVIALLLIDAGAILLNMLVLVIIYQDSLLREKTDCILIANLALSDLLVALAIMPFSIDTLLYPDHQFSTETSTFIGFANFFFCISSIMILFFLVLDQTCIIKWPLRYERYRTRRLAIAASFYCWLHSSACALPPALGLSSYNCFIINIGPCSAYDWAGTNNSIIFAVLVITCSWGIALIGTIVCYIQILIIVVKQQKRMAVQSSVSGTRTRSLNNGRVAPFTIHLNRSPYIERLDSSPNIERLSSSPDIERLSRSPNIERWIRSPNIERLNSSPNIERLSSSPDIERLSRSPNIERWRRSPNIERLNSSPNIERLSRSPNVKRSVTINIKEGRKMTNINTMEGKGRVSVAVNAITARLLATQTLQKHFMESCSSTDSPNLESDDAKIRRIVDKSIWKPAKALLLIISIYFFSWSPFCIVLLAEIALKRKLISNISLIFLWIGHSSSLLNPILYFLRYKKFRVRAIKLYYTIRQWFVDRFH